MQKVTPARTQQKSQNCSLKNISIYTHVTWSARTLPLRPPPHDGSTTGGFESRDSRRKDGESADPGKCLTYT